jgi:YbbR domain-containing protein
MRDFLTKDLGWKLFSCALAFAVWLTVQALRHDSRSAGFAPTAAWTTRTFKQIPVLAVSAAADVRAFEVKPVSVDVTVGGRPEVIGGLTEKEIRVTVDLTVIESAKDVRKRVDVATPPGITFVLAEPAAVDVEVPPRPVSP